MAVPKSWMNAFLRRRKKPKAKKAKTSRTPKTVPPKGTHPVNSRRRKPGFTRGLAGAVSGEILRDTGHIGSHITKKIAGKLHEMDGAGGLGGTPTNSASSGAVAGLGQPGSSEPGVKKKK